MIKSLIKKMLSKTGFYHKNQIYKEFLFLKPDYLNFLFGLVLFEISKKLS